MLQKAVGKDLSDAMKDFLRIAIFYNKILYNDIKHGNGPGIWQSLYDKGLDDGQKLHTVKDGGEFRFENITAILVCLSNGCMICINASLRIVMKMGL
jgi:hypothetical protein